MAMNPAVSTLDGILEKAIQEVPLEREELLLLLGLSDTEDLSKVFETARLLRTRYFQDRVFIYGFVYFSTYCRKWRAIRPEYHSRLCRRRATLCPWLSRPSSKPSWCGSRVPLERCSTSGRAKWRPMARGTAF